eukprot:1913515-Prymnesium_polylepis.1
MAGVLKSSSPSSTTAWQFGSVATVASRSSDATVVRNITPASPSYSTVPSTEDGSRAEYMNSPTSSANAKTTAVQKPKSRLSAVKGYAKSWQNSTATEPTASQFRQRRRRKECRWPSVQSSGRWST